MRDLWAIGVNDGSWTWTPNKEDRLGGRQKWREISETWKRDSSTCPSWTLLFLFILQERKQGWICFRLSTVPWTLPWQVILQQVRWLCVQTLFKCANHFLESCSWNLANWVNLTKFSFKTFFFHGISISE